MPTHLIHRGLANRNFKENTIPAFKHCFKKNYGIETDVHCTKDDKIVCFHDFNLQNKFKINKRIKDINYEELKKISIKFKSEIPLLDKLLKISPSKLHLMIEIKPIFSKKNLISLFNKTKRLKNYSLTSFHEKNLISLYKLNNKLSLGLIFSSRTKLETFKIKSKKKFIKLLVVEKKFLDHEKLDALNVPIYYYTAKCKNIFNKYKNSKNLIFENL
jgi:glycerophosphoryl diester phosphodiesterase